MPIHRIPVSLEGAASLDRKIAEVEAAGERVVQVTTHANEWIIVTGGGRREIRRAAS